MPYVEVHYDYSDVIDDIPDSVMREELVRRARKRGESSEVMESIPAIVARDVLDEASSLYRKAGHFDMAFKLDEIRYDFIESTLPRNK